MTLEEAQDKIVELTEQLETVTSERDSLSQDNETLTNDIENLRALNQKYFNKLIAQEKPEDENQEDEKIPSCEEFAQTLTI